MYAPGILWTLRAPQDSASQALMHNNRGYHQELRCTMPGAMADRHNREHQTRHYWKQNHRGPDID